MKILSKLSIFLLISLSFIIISSVFVFVYDKEELHLLLNHYHIGFFDTFFTYFTYIGNGYFIISAIIILVLLVRKQIVSNLLLGILTFPFSGLLVQFFKHILFSDYYRPIKLIGQDMLYLIPGVAVHSSYSFPSGHTTSAFALFIFLAFLFRQNKWTQAFFAISAILVACSRVYLSQHFLEDVILGAILGIISFLLVYALLSIFYADLKKL